MYIRLKKAQPRKLPSKATAYDRRAGYTAETDAVKKPRIKHIYAMHVTIPPPHEYNAWTGFRSEYGKPLDRVRQTPAKKRRNTGLRIMPTSETVRQYHNSHPNPFNCI